MPAQNPRRDQLSGLLMNILQGGGGRQGDPFINEQSMFGRPQAAAPPPRAPAPAARPKAAAGGGGGAGKAGGGKKTGGGKAAPKRAPNQTPDPRNATSPSSLLESPGLNATSPSSLLVSPPASAQPPYLGSPDITSNRYFGPQPTGAVPSPAPMGGPGGGTRTGQPYPTAPAGNPLTAAVDAAPFRVHDTGYPPPGGASPANAMSLGAGGGGTPGFDWSFGFNDAVRNTEQGLGKPSRVPRQPSDPTANALASVPPTGSGTGPGSPWWNWLTGITGGL